MHWHAVTPDGIADHRLFELQAFGRDECLAKVLVRQSDHLCEEVLHLRTHVKQLTVGQFRDLPRTLVRRRQVADENDAATGRPRAPPTGR